MPIFQLTNEITFPDPALAEPNGLLAVGGDLSPERLLCAYSQGIFPWYSANQPILWWFTSPRLIIEPQSMRIAPRLQRYFRNTHLTLTINKDFNGVIEACAAMPRKGQDGSWLRPEMIQAYQHLNTLGFAHSVECWQEEALAGGLYGIALGKVFFGESMFSRVTNSSKFALIHLVHFLSAQQYRLIDCQMTTPHLVSLGAFEIDGRQFQDRLKQLIFAIKPDQNWNDDTNQ